MNPNGVHISTEEEKRVRAASQWLMELQSNNLSEADVLAWTNWCAADPENLRAFDDVRCLYDELRALKTSDRELFLSIAHIDAIKHVHERREPRVARTAHRARRVIAAGVAASVLFVGLLWWQLGSSGIEARDYQVARGAQRAVVLADDSQVILASASEVFSRFTADTRFLELRAGEAYFEVKHERTRPFVVKAGPLTVRAVGTKFNIRRTTDRTVVVVMDGVVDVTTKETLAIEPSRDAWERNEGVTTTVRVRTGQQAVRASAQRGLNVSDVNSAAAIAWRGGRLEYIMEPLGSVVEDVNRYTSRRIVIADKRLKNLVFTGTIFQDRVDEWAMTLAGAFPIRAKIDANGTVRLEAQSEDKLTDFR